MECNFLLLYLWLLALFYMLPFFWNTHYSYVVFLSVFRVHHIPFVHLSPYSLFPLPTEEVFKTYAWSYFSTVFTFSNFFTLIHYGFGCCLFYSLTQHFPPILPAPFQFHVSIIPLLSYITLLHFIQNLFNFIKDAK